MRASKHLTDLRQLCCLGLGGQRIMPLVIDIIHEVVPADSMVFFWADEKYDVANLYSPDLPQMAEIASLYITEFANTREREAKPPFSHVMQNERGVVNWIKYENKKYFKSDFYNMILQPLQVRHLLGVIIDDRQRSLGELIIMRRPGGIGFSQGDEQALAPMISYIAHGLTGWHHSDISYAESRRKGLIVLNQKAELQYLCAEARELLFWARDPRFAQGETNWSSSALLPQEVLTICKNLARIYQGRDVSPPVWNCRNGWGSFTFRAYWLENERHDKNALIGITVEMQEPQPLHVLSQLRQFPLSPRQKEVCMMLLSGRRSREISQKLNMSRHTLIHHMRGIYHKTGLRSRTELFTRFGISVPDRSRSPNDSDFSEFSH